jgi:hypothetical protein
MNRDERRERAAGITTALLLGAIVGILIIKLILTLVY